jgi:hypothetical protein
LCELCTAWLHRLQVLRSNSNSDSPSVLTRTQIKVCGALHHLPAFRTGSEKTRRTFFGGPQLPSVAHTPVAAGFILRPRLTPHGHMQQPICAYDSTSRAQQKPVANLRAHKVLASYKEQTRINNSMPFVPNANIYIST